MSSVAIHYSYASLLCNFGYYNSCHWDDDCLHESMKIYLDNECFNDCCSWLGDHKHDLLFTIFLLCLIFCVKYYGCAIQIDTHLFVLYDLGFCMDCCQGFFE